LVALTALAQQALVRQELTLAFPSVPAPEPLPVTLGGAALYMRANRLLPLQRRRLQSASPRPKAPLPASRELLLH
jgi:hypothetical protein